jgi:hypothetical protein
MMGYCGQRCELRQTTTTTTTTTTTKQMITINPDCYDKDPFSCPLYASQNMCSDMYIIKDEYLPKYCAKSCGMCLSVGCCDNQPNCHIWAEMNLCDRIHLIDPLLCRKSCPKPNDDCNNNLNVK